MKKENLQTVYRNKTVLCCEPGVLKYESKVRIEKFNKKHDIFQLEKLFESGNTDDNSQQINTL